MIELKDVSKIYRIGEDAFYALKNINLTINKGEFVAILGPSGSGKSTLMHLIGGLDQPTFGTATIHGMNLNAMSEKDLANYRNRTIGFIFQSFNLLPYITATKNVALPLLYSSLRVDREARAVMLLRHVGLSHRLHNKPTELSGGEQQRVAIARALATDPDIIMADEPTGNLDSKTGTQIINMFAGLHAMGKTVIIVTHDESLATHADRIIRIQDGTIL